MILDLRLPSGDQTDRYKDYRLVQALERLNSIKPHHWKLKMLKRFENISYLKGVKQEEQNQKKGSIKVLLVTFDSFTCTVFIFCNQQQGNDCMTAMNVWKDLHLRYRGENLRKAE